MRVWTAALGAALISLCLFATPSFAQCEGESCGTPPTECEGTGCGGPIGCEADECGGPIGCGGGEGGPPGGGGGGGGPPLRPCPRDTPGALRPPPPPPP